MRIHGENQDTLASSICKIVYYSIFFSCEYVIFFQKSTWKKDLGIPLWYLFHYQIYIHLFCYFKIWKQKQKPKNNFEFSWLKWEIWWLKKQHELLKNMYYEWITTDSGFVMNIFHAQMKWLRFTWLCCSLWLFCKYVLDDKVYSNCLTVHTIH